MAAYVVVEIAIKDNARYERYKHLAPPSIAKYGGKYLTRGGATSALEGTWAPERFVILEFADVATARRWWDSPEYAEAKKLRQSCAETQMLLVEGKPFDPASA
jgi:uncharacterized protein (DUF1330 family)